MRSHNCVAFLWVTSLITQELVHSEFQPAVLLENSLYNLSLASFSCVKLLVSLPNLFIGLPSSAFSLPLPVSASRRCCVNEA